jgi:monoamine oxidase
LTAAREVAKQGRSVLVLEARDRVGGRVLTHSLTGGGYSELGARFTGPTQDHIQALASDVGVGTFPTYNTGNNVFVGGDGRREEFPSDTPLGTAPADPLVAPDIALAVAQLDEMAKEVPVDEPWTSWIPARPLARRAARAGGSARLGVCGARRAGTRERRRRVRSRRRPPLRRDDTDANLAVRLAPEHVRLE